jgi:hypothetical protein
MESLAYTASYANLVALAHIAEQYAKINAPRLKDVLRSIEEMSKELDVMRMFPPRTDTPPHISVPITAEELGCKS